MSLFQLEEPLVQSREFNRSKNITGILLYCDGSFMQLLEGDEVEIRALYGRIEKDRRNYDVRTLLTLHTSERWCKDWAMGFSLCAHRGELESCINIATENSALKDHVGASNPLAEVLTGFVERNQRLFGA